MQSFTELSDLRNSRWVVEANLPATGPHPDLSEWTTKGGNSGIKIDDNKR